MLKRLPISVLLLMAVWSFSLTAQDLSKKEKRSLEKQKQFELLKKIVQKDSLEIEFDHCNSSSMGYKDLTTNLNYLKLQNDSAYAFLPYFGVAYKARMDSKGGINFENIRENEKITTDDKKLKVNFSFEAKSDFDQYKCNLSLFANGTVTLIVVSNYYQTITYDGKITGWDEMVKQVDGSIGYQ